MSLLLEPESRSIFLLRKSSGPPHHSGSLADPFHRCADHDSHYGPLPQPESDKDLFKNLSFFFSKLLSSNKIITFSS